MNRNIVKDITAFGNLGDFVDFHNDTGVNESCMNYFEKKIKKNIPTRGFLQYSPKYNIQNNKIGIYFLKGNPKKLQPCLPKLKSVERELESGEHAKKYRLEQNKPEAFLSVHHLPKIIFLELHEKGISEKIIREFLEGSSRTILDEKKLEKIREQLMFNTAFIKKTSEKKLGQPYGEHELKELKKRKEELEKILNENGLSLGHLSGRMVNNLLNIQKHGEADISFRRKVKEIEEDTKHRLKIFKTRGEKTNRMKFPKIGEMATFIARDIIYLIIDENKKNKVTSFYYDRLQKSLAFFPSKEDGYPVFRAICFETFNLAFEPGGHPFLKDINVDHIDNTLEMYEKYLFLKEKWIRKTFYTGRGRQKVFRRPPEKFLPYKLKKILSGKSNYTEWFMNVQDRYKKPVDLPAGLFDQKTREIFKQLLREKNLFYHENDNFAKLLERSFNEDAQPYYKANRKYKVFKQEIVFYPLENKRYKDIFLDKAGEIAKENDKLTQKQVIKYFNDSITENEKIIRHYLTKDRLVLGMCNKLLGAGAEEIRLAEFVPSTGKNPLEMEVEIKKW